MAGTTRDFIVQVTRDIHEQRAFIHFYKTINSKLRQAGDKKRKQGWYHFNAIAMERMPIDHPEWYVQIKPFITNINAILDPAYDDVRKAIRFFMTRYGAYQEFIRRTKQQQAEETVVVQNDQGQTGCLWNAISSSIAYLNDSLRSSWRYMCSKISA